MPVRYDGAHGGPIVLRRIVPLILLAAGCSRASRPRANGDANPIGTIVTVAGIAGRSGPLGDGGPAVRAYLTNPLAVAEDSMGNVYVATQSRIRRISPDGTITTVAGTGESGFSGDGGPAIHAKLRSPEGIVVTPGGEVVVVDSGNGRIRRIGRDGIIATIAGTGRSGFAGDGGPALGAAFDVPRAAAFASNGDLYISDELNHRIRKIARSGIVTTVAGTGAAGFSGDGGPAVRARMDRPQGIATDARGNLFIADSGNERIRRVTPDGRISTVAGSGRRGFSGDGGPARRAALFDPYGVAIDGRGDLFIADTFNQCIRKVDPAGTISTVAGIGNALSHNCCDDVVDVKDGGRATDGRLDFPFGIAIDRAGDLLIADTKNNRIRRVGGLAAGDVR